MKRKMIGAAAAFLSGLFFASFFNMRSGIFLLISAAVIVFLSGRKRGFKGADYALIFLSFTTAALYFELHTALKYAPVIACADKTGSFNGKITEYDLFDGAKARYVLKGTINGETKAKITVYTDELDADYGDIVTIGSCTFTEFSDSYLSSSRKYYRSKGIFLTASRAKDITVTRTKSGGIRAALSRYRELMTGRLRYIMGKECGGFMAGMLFGDKEYLESSLRTSLYRCGVGHILAVSGLHITVAAYFIMSLISRLDLGRPVTFILLNIFLAAFVTISRFPSSAIRAVLMIDISFSAALFKRESDPFNSLAAAVLFMTAANPYIIYSGGFLLSVSGTFGIAVLGPYLSKGIESRLGRGMILGICTSAAVMPASVSLFDETSLIAPIANVTIVPICSAAMIFGFVYIITGGIFSFILSPAILMIKAVTGISELTARSGIMRLTSPNGTISVMLTLSMVTALAMHLFYNDRSLLGAFLSVSVTLCILLSFTDRLCGRKYITAAMLGKDSISAVIITIGESVCIIDMGTDGDGYAEKYLTVNGIDRVDALILTKNINHAYSAYAHRLSLFYVGEVYSLGGTAVISPDELTVTADTLDLTSKLGTLSIDSGGGFILTDTRNGSRLSSADLTGSMKYKRISVIDTASAANLTETSGDFDGTIGDFGCNYEIVLSADGQYKIRSLYG